MAEEAPPDVPSEPADNAPLRERVESKTWKTRMEAFVELAKVRHPIRPQLQEGRSDGRSCVCAVAQPAESELTKRVSYDFAGV